MSVKIEMPQLSADGESATLASWLVAVGDEVAAGDVIAELETDKSTVELEAPASGTVSEILVAEGTEEITPGTLLATISGEGDSAAIDSAATETVATESAAPPAKDDDAGPPDAPVVPAKTPASAGAAASDGAKRAATPLARRAAADHGLDLTEMAGSGPGGRIVQEDVLRSASGAAVSADASGAGPVAASPQTASTNPPASGVGEDAEAPFELERLSAMRKTIARRLAESKREIPHFYLSMRCSMDLVVGVRARLNEGLAAEGRDIKISVNDFVVRAAALALREIPEANVSYTDEGMRVYQRVDISVAVATEGGLVTPVVRDADRKGLTVLAEEVKSMALRARDGSLLPEEYQGGTFTISNLGMYGVETVYPILNPPQACILGVGAAEEKAVVRDGEIGIGREVTLTLAADHRAVDGAVGARLLAAIRGRLEDPLGMML